jgi:acyl dehydratase
MLDRDKHVGVVSEPRMVEVEKGFLKFFAHATGETDPVYFDEDAAKAAGHPTIPAPPTYMFSLDLGAPAKRGHIFDTENGLGVSMSQVLHGEQTFTYHQPIYAGDRLMLVTTTSDIYAKKGGALEFVVDQLTVGQELPELVRGPITRGTLALFAGASNDYVLLHIDSDYAKEAGMGDVFGHGMLSMAYLAQAVRSWAPAERLRTWNVRFAAITPLYATVTCRGSVEEIVEQDGERLARLKIGAFIDDGTQTIGGEALIALD